MVGCSHAHGKGFRAQNILGRLVSFGQADAHHVIRIDSSPRRIHGVGVSILVVRCHNKYGHRVQPCFYSKILSHSLYILKQHLFRFSLFP